MSPGKPPCDWDDPAAREALVDALVRDVMAAVEIFDGHSLDPMVAEVARLVADLAGQDVEEGEDGIFRIAKGVAADGMISAVDTQARHGRKSHDRRFDGYRTHVSVDPDTELIDETAVRAANVADHDAVDDLLGGFAEAADKPIVVGACAYGDGETISSLEFQGFEAMTKAPAAHGRDDRFGKDDFAVGLDAATVTCPAGVVAPIRWAARGGGLANFGPACTSCPLAPLAPPTGRGGLSASIPTNRSSSGTRPISAPPNGSRPIPASVPRWSAKSLISPLASGAAARSAPEVSSGSPPMSTPGPRRSTGRACTCSGSTGTGRLGGGRTMADGEAVSPGPSVICPLLVPAVPESPEQREKPGKERSEHQSRGPKPSSHTAPSGNTSP